MLQTHGFRVVYNIPTTLFGTMKKLTHLYIVAFLALTLGLMLSCAKKDDGSSSSDNSSSSSDNSSPFTVSEITQTVGSDGLYSGSFDAETACIVVYGACKGVTCGGHGTVKFTYSDLCTLNIRPFLDFTTDSNGL